MQVSSVTVPADLHSRRTPSPQFPRPEPPSRVQPLLVTGQPTRSVRARPAPEPLFADRVQRSNRCIGTGVRNEVQAFGWQIGEHDSSVYQITSGPFTMWLVETDVMAKLGQPILSLVSRVFLNEPECIIESLRQTGRELLLCYVLQQVARFRQMGKEFAMQHAGTEYLDEVEDKLQAILDGMPVENRLRGLHPEERLRGLTPEELAAGLTDEQAERLRELLERRQGK
jgi:hypothetical protein